MNTANHRVRTTHVGSLPRPPELIDMLHAKDSLRAYDRSALDRGVRNSIDDIVARQVALGIDIVNDGEHSKSSFMAYGRRRLGGIEETTTAAAHRKPTRDALAFPDVYAESAAMNNARNIGGLPPKQRLLPATICSGPIRYIGQDDLAADIANLKSALSGSPAEGAFMTAISPTNLELYYRNEYYRSDEEYLEALANAMNVEYRAIVDAGFILQIAYPRLATHYNRTPGASIDECRDFIALRVETVNHALKGMPREKVRFHTCYSVNVAPRVHDMELTDYLDLMLRINAQAFSFEAANPRHEHEWAVWADAKLPDDIILLPGVVSHCVHLVEHPELVAQRIPRYADIVGPERVIASNDCGFASSAAGDEVHPDVAWVKLQSLTDGARLASAKLW